MYREYTTGELDLLYLCFIYQLLIAYLAYLAEIQMGIFSNVQGPSDGTDWKDRESGFRENGIRTDGM